MCIRDRLIGYVLFAVQHDPKDRPNVRLLNISSCGLQLKHWWNGGLWESLGVPFWWFWKVPEKCWNFLFSAISLCSLCIVSPYPPIDSIMRLMTVWRITEKIIRTIYYCYYMCTIVMASFYSFKLGHFCVFCFILGYNFLFHCREG